MPPPPQKQHQPIVPSATARAKDTGPGTAYWQHERRRGNDFSQHDRLQEAFRFVRRIWQDDEWSYAPECQLMDYVPVQARPLFVEQLSALMRHASNHSDDPARWFALLRLFPATVCAELLYCNDLVNKRWYLCKTNVKPLQDVFDI